MSILQDRRIVDRDSSFQSRLWFCTAALSLAFGACWLIRNRPFISLLWKDSLISKDDRFDLVSNLSAASGPKVLNIHVVPLTHDDVGWLKTVEQYFHGENNTIQHACVHDILDSVVQSLLQNPQRTFTYVETKFFSMWWNQQSDIMKDSVRFLIANKQLTFSNGGWCMHDEATTHFMGMIDQTTLGHTFLKNELGVVPKVGWQLDPFGHSSTQASLLTAKVGFDATYFGRIDYQDFERRRRTQEREGLWQASASTNDTVFWGLSGSYEAHYGPPPGFCFDFQCDLDQHILGLNETFLLKRIHEFLVDVQLQSDETRGNHVMLTMGEDFNYERAQVNFANLDLLIGTTVLYQRSGLINITEIFGPRFERVEIFYSSPEYYTERKYQETIDAKSDQGIWSIKKDDFFPYSDCEHCFWTGYFTSRAAFKRLERVGSSFLLAARQIESNMCDEEPSTGSSPLYALDDALGVAQHHDAVSGTAKQHVANDYAKRIQAGIDTASSFIVQRIRDLILNASDTSRYLQDLAYCQLLNETSCDVSENAGPGTDLYVVVYNALAQNRSTVVSLPVSAADALFRVSRVGGTTEDQKLISSLKEHNPFHDSQNVLHFHTGVLPPVGGVVFRVERTNMTSDDSFGTETNDPNTPLLQSNPTTSISRRLMKDSQDVKVSNGLLTATFDGSTGMMKHVSTEKGGINVSQTWGYYVSFDSSQDTTEDASNSTQCSGAYIFRPSRPDQQLTPIAAKRGSVVVRNLTVGTEVRVEFEEPWLRQVTRILDGAPYVEIEYTVGPIPIDDGRGKEIVSRFSTPIQSNGIFFTDSNGREFQQRQRNHRPTWNLTVYEPVAGNYYPVNAATYLQDDIASLAVVVDRSQGGASLVDGSIELMVHRRTLKDDWRGVSEAINETTGGMTPYPPYGNAARLGGGIIIRGKHRILIGPGLAGASVARSVMDGVFAEPLIFVGSAPSNDPVPVQHGSFSLIQEALPKNVMLVTFALLHSAPAAMSFLIRLGHQYGIDEDEDLSEVATVDLLGVLGGYEIVTITEKTLSGNEDYSEWAKRRFNWTGSEYGQVPHDEDFTNGDTVVTLYPMEIRTFEVQVA